MTDTAGERLPGFGAEAFAGHHGGDMRVRSEPGDTRFEVRLPVDR